MDEDQKMQKMDGSDIMGPPNDVPKIGKQVFLEAIGDQVYVDWPKDGSFQTLVEVQAILMTGLQAIANTMAQQAMMGQRPFPGKPLFSPQRN